MPYRNTNGFLERPDLILHFDTVQIITQLTANPLFASPKPTLAQVTDCNTRFNNSILAAAGGDRYAIIARNAIKRELVDLLHGLGNYVTFIANGDPAIIESTGFTANKSPEPQPKVTTPAHFKAEEGVNPGEIKLSFRRVPGARAYQYFTTPEPLTNDSVWTSQVSTRCREVVTNLQSGKRYYCKVAAIGSGQHIAFSEVITRVVQ